MSHNPTNDPLKTDREITFTRLLDAPRNLVFDVWTQPEHLLKWWGPDGFTQTFYEYDLRVGGIWHFMMHGPDGRDYPNKIVFTDVTKPERLAFKHSGAESEGVSHETEITFEEEKGKTKLTMKMIFSTAEEMQRVMKEYGAEEGGKQHLAKLTAYVNQLTVQKVLTITRVLDAPIDLVFKAFSEAERLAQWWGPKGMNMGVTHLDFRPGGRFHYSMTTPDGQQMWGLFVYQQIIAPELIIFVSSFSDKDGNIARAPFKSDWPLEVRTVLSLQADGNKTILTMRGAPINATAEEYATFEGFFGSMQEGWAGTFSQLDAYLQSA